MHSCASIACLLGLPHHPRSLQGFLGLGEILRGPFHGENPFRLALNSRLHAHPRFPPDFPQRADVGRQVAKVHRPILPRPRRHHLGPVCCTQKFSELQERRWPTRSDVEYPSICRVALHHRYVGARDVLHEDEVPRLAPVLADDLRQPVQQAGREDSSKPPCKG